MLKHYSLLVALGLSYALTAQSADPHTIVPDGGTAYGPDLLLTWSLGEIATATLPTPGGYLTEGFQQPALYVQPPLPGTVAGDAPLLRVFPNPVTSSLRVELTEEADQPVHLEFFDTAGRLVWRSHATDGQTSYTIDVAAYPAGAYHLRAIPTAGTAKPSQTFTIIKNNKL